MPRLLPLSYEELSGWKETITTTHSELDTGNSLSIWKDPLIPWSYSFKQLTLVRVEYSDHKHKVLNPKDPQIGEWNINLVNTFWDEKSSTFCKCLCPLSMLTWIWYFMKDCLFSVRSVYHLGISLQSSESSDGAKVKMEITMEYSLGIRITTKN